MGDVDPVEAWARLDSYLKLHHECRGLEAQRNAHHVTMRLDPTRLLRGALDMAGLEQIVSALGKARDELLRRADEVDELLKRVNVTGFNPHMPEDPVGRSAIVRAIGRYERWVETERDPNPPAPSNVPAPQLAPVAVELAPSQPHGRRKVPRWLLTTLISTFTWAVGLVWGDTKTCEPNVQGECKARDGSPGAQWCAWHGRAWSDCQAFASTATAAQPCAPSPTP